MEEQNDPNPVEDYSGSQSERSFLGASGLNSEPNLSNVWKNAFGALHECQIIADPVTQPSSQFISAPVSPEANLEGEHMSNVSPNASIHLTDLSHSRVIRQSGRNFPGFPNPTAVGYHPWNPMWAGPNAPQPHLNPIFRNHASAHPDQMRQQTPQRGGIHFSPYMITPGQAAPPYTYPYWNAQRFPPTNSSQPPSYGAQRVPRYMNQSPHQGPMHYPEDKFNIPSGPDYLHLQHTQRNNYVGGSCYVYSGKELPTQTPLNPRPVNSRQLYPPNYRAAAYPSNRPVCSGPCCSQNARYGSPPIQRGPPNHPLLTTVANQTHNFMPPVQPNFYENHGNLHPGFPLPQRPSYTWQTVNPIQEAELNPPPQREYSILQAQLENPNFLSNHSDLIEINFDNIPADRASNHEVSGEEYNVVQSPSDNQDDNTYIQEQIGPQSEFHSFNEDQSSVPSTLAINNETLLAGSQEGNPEGSVDDNSDPSKNTGPENQAAFTVSLPGGGELFTVPIMESETKDSAESSAIAGEGTPPPSTPCESGTTDEQKESSASGGSSSDRTRSPRTDKKKIKLRSENNNAPAQQRTTRNKATKKEARHSKVVPKKIRGKSVAATSAAPAVTTKSKFQKMDYDTSTESGESTSSSEQSPGESSKCKKSGKAKVAPVQVDGTATVIRRVRPIIRGEGKQLPDSCIQPPSILKEKILTEHSIFSMKSPVRTGATTKPSMPNHDPKADANPKAKNSTMSEQILATTMEEQIPEVTLTEQIPEINFYSSPRISSPKPAKLRKPRNIHFSPNIPRGSTLRSRMYTEKNNSMKNANIFEELIFGEGYVSDQEEDTNLRPSLGKSKTLAQGELNSNSDDHDDDISTHQGKINHDAAASTSLPPCNHHARMSPTQITPKEGPTGLIVLSISKEKLKKPGGALTLLGKNYERNFQSQHQMFEDGRGLAKEIGQEGANSPATSSSHVKDNPFPREQVKQMHVDPTPPPQLENQASRSVVEQCGNHEMQDTGRSTENEIITDESAHNIIQVELLECRVNNESRHASETEPMDLSLHGVRIKQKYYDQKDRNKYVVYSAVKGKVYEEFQRYVDVPTAYHAGAGPYAHLPSFLKENAKNPDSELSTKTQNTTEMLLERKHVSAKFGQLPDFANFAPIIHEYQGKFAEVDGNKTMAATTMTSNFQLTKCKFVQNAQGRMEVCPESEREAPRTQTISRFQPNTSVSRLVGPRPLPLVHNAIQTPSVAAVISANKLGGPSNTWNANSVTKAVLYDGNDGRLVKRIAQRTEPKELMDEEKQSLRHAYARQIAAKIAARRTATRKKNFNQLLMFPYGHSKKARQSRKPSKLARLRIKLSEHMSRMFILGTGNQNTIPVKSASDLMLHLPGPFERCSRSNETRKASEKGHRAASWVDFQGNFMQQSPANKDEGGAAVPPHLQMNSFLASGKEVQLSEDDNRDDDNGIITEDLEASKDYYRANPASTEDAGFTFNNPSESDHAPRIFKRDMGETSTTEVTDCDDTLSTYADNDPNFYTIVEYPDSE